MIAEGEGKRKMKLEGRAKEKKKRGRDKCERKINKRLDRRNWKREKS